MELKRVLGQVLSRVPIGREALWSAVACPVLCTDLRSPEDALSIAPHFIWSIYDECADGYHEEARRAGSG